MSPRMGLPARRTSVWVGIVRLASFHIDGLEQFGHTPAAFLNSLAPLLALQLVSGYMTLLLGAGRLAMANVLVGVAALVLVGVIALLTPALISYYFARLWRREALWLRYAIAFNWCDAAVVLMLLGGFLSARMAGPGPLAASLAAISLFVLPFYGLIVLGFVSRHGLRISVPRAVLLVASVLAGTLLLTIGPSVLALLVGFAQGG
jgi:hypothetical protein